MLARIAPVAAIVLASAGVITALVLMGSPNQARLVKLDTIRAYNAQAIIALLDDDYGRKSNSLPTTLAALPPSDNNFLAVRDPQTKQLYEYHRLSAHRYTLCINFAAPTDPGATEGDVKQWAHIKPGRDCKTLGASRQDKPR